MILLLQVLDQLDQGNHIFIDMLNFLMVMISNYYN